MEKACFEREFLVARVLTTHRHIARLIRYFTFNLGLFEMIKDRELSSCYLFEVVDMAQTIVCRYWCH